MMKDNVQISDCGTVLNKSAVGDDFKWGLRFYILLLNCFKQWAAFTDDDDIKARRDELDQHISTYEDVYYFQEL